MGIITWFQGAVAWLQTDGRWDLVTLGVAFATFIYVAAAIAVSIRSELQTGDDRMKANLSAASVKQAAGQSRLVEAT